MSHLTLLKRRIKEKFKVSIFLIKMFPQYFILKLIKLEKKSRL